MALALASDLRVPRFFTLGFNPKGYYVSFDRDGGEMDGCIRFVGTNVESPYTKFEAEAAKADGLFHIRSCQNNRYWERNKTPQTGWITATALKKEEDQSKSSCTLFKLVSVDAATPTVRMVHVQSGNYLFLCEADQSELIAAFVAFKGDNGYYLCLRYHDSHRAYMQFESDDLGDSTVPLETFVTTDGNVRIRSICVDQFWRRSPNWIWADSDDTSSDNKDTLFRPVQADNKTIGLINLGNNNFCKSLTTEGKTDCLNAAVSSLVKEAQLTVEEPILKREIYDVRYNLDYSRVYDESVLVVATTSATNDTQESNTKCEAFIYRYQGEYLEEQIFTQVRHESHRGL
ncbi:hypothetical protein V6N11_066688 [Hibiscus sabdariffa]|uniref:Agglutinin domain-containing protein n=2 Tax=Hibiscus sabdariffa TaxID=183260 RepID=A0ABR1ZBM9_9ROSI